MAAPFTHILFARLFLDHNSAITPKKFIIGTSFPDIRHLSSLLREHTHAPTSDLSPIYEDIDPFRAGMRFHSYIDNARSSYWKNSGIYELFEPSPLLSTSLKFYEDIVLYDRGVDTDEVIQYFNSFIESEFRFGASVDDVSKWHAMLQEYLATAPTVDSIEQFLRPLPISDNGTQAVCRIIKTMSKNPSVSDQIQEFFTTQSAALREVSTYKN